MFVRSVLILGLLALTACETVGGAGRDIQSAGRVLERESYEAQRY
ncbi:putative small secreted protein [Palleronia aestuarii]|uniref:Putative small secreted protein n=1 Tax=Palleronia aestuarii TaxID=568105 RepID=A0A2W7NRB2_9RHOB|nr:entericidin A/B family lipoprotein [Palleronia aestuarii]PZX15786.1 putative small secreted protein [Palleronia aestuarii]